MMRRKGGQKMVLQQVLAGKKFQKIGAVLTAARAKKTLK